VIFCDKCTLADLGFSEVVSLGETPFSSTGKRLLGIGTHWIIVRGTVEAGSEDTSENRLQQYNRYVLTFYE